MFDRFPIGATVDDMKNLEDKDLRSVSAGLTQASASHGFGRLYWQGYPLIESFLARGFGTGVRHRGAAVAIQVVNSTTYTLPVIEL